MKTLLREFKNSWNSEQW